MSVFSENKVIINYYYYDDDDDARQIKGWRQDTLMSSPGLDIQTFPEFYFLLHILACDSNMCLPTVKMLSILT